MKHWQMGSGVVLAAIFFLAGCGAPPPSLTGAELQEKYADKTYAEIDGVNLHYRQIGLGRPLIFLHGLLEDSRMWRHVTPGLTYGNTVYEIDLMGFGLSEKPQDRTYDMDTYVSQLSTYIENFHLENLILVGHDFGAVIATAYAIHNPNRVYKLVLMSAPISSSIPLHFNFRLLGTRVIGSMLTGDWFLQRILKEGIHNEDERREAKLKEYLQPFHDDPGARQALPKFLREFGLRQAVETELLPNLDKLSMPTLLLWGSQDPFTPMDVARELDVAISTADLQVVTRSGHYFLEDRPEDVRQKLKDWIDQR